MVSKVNWMRAGHIKWHQLKLKWSAPLGFLFQSFMAGALIFLFFPWAVYSICFLWSIWDVISFPFALSRAEFVALPNCSCIYKPNGKSSLCLKFMFLLDLLCCFGVIFLLKTNLTCYQICRHDVIAQICYAKRLAQKLQPVARMVDLPGGHLVSHERTEEVYLHIYHTKYIYYSWYDYLESGNERWACFVSHIRSIKPFLSWSRLQKLRQSHMTGQICLRKVPVSNFTLRECISPLSTC